MTTNAVSVWDFTAKVHEDVTDEVQMIKEKLRDIAKQWVFQKEQGEGGYVHYQGRVSLKVKTRKPTSAYSDWEDVRWSPTSKDNAGNVFYVTKEDTRVEGPWSNKEQVKYIPKQFRNAVPRGWQQTVIEKSKVWSDRTVNIIYDPIGNHGKSWLASYCELYGKGVDLPSVNDSKELMQALYGICAGKDLREPNPIFMDLPRAFDKSKLHGVYSAIEQIKKGKLVDLRYEYKEYWIESPAIWVITNREPDLALLSRDRWVIWTISDSHELVPYQEKGIGATL